MTPAHLASMRRILGEAAEWSRKDLVPAVLKAASVSFKDQGVVKMVAYPGGGQTVSIQFPLHGGQDAMGSLPRADDILRKITGWKIVRHKGAEVFSPKVEAGQPYAEWYLDANENELLLTVGVWDGGENDYKI